LIISAAVIAYKSVQNILTPHKVPQAWTLIVLGIIIIWKEASYRFVLKKSQETGSSSLEADAWHHRSDAITSITAFLGISIAVFLGKGYENADDWAALFASVFIVYNSYLIFRPALGEIMDEHRYDELAEKIRKVAVEVKGIKDLHALGDGEISVRHGHDLAHKLKDTLLEKIPSLADILIHIEPDDWH
jgi:cation diffusion facilitator family transporter